MKLKGRVLTRGMVKNNVVGDDGARSMAVALEQNTSLTRLVLNVR